MAWMQSNTCYLREQISDMIPAIERQMKSEKEESQLNRIVLVFLSLGKEQSTNENLTE